MRNKATGWVRREDAGVRVRSRQPLFLRFLVVGPPDLEQKGAKSRRDWFPRPHSPCGPLRPSVQDRSGGDLIRRSGSRAVSDPDVVRGQKRTCGGSILSRLFDGALGEVALPDGQPRTSNVQPRTSNVEELPTFDVQRSTFEWERPARASANSTQLSHAAVRTLRMGDFALGICCAISNRESSIPNPQFPRVCALCCGSRRPAVRNWQRRQPTARSLLLRPRDQPPPRLRLGRPVAPGCVKRVRVLCGRPSRASLPCDFAACPTRRLSPSGSCGNLWP